ncbi:hypothetical protein C3736_06810 [Escherichia coli]|nr:hypothetical protein C6P57_18805 [Escherichia coli]OYI05460.1 hypothetical protein CI701_02515 [Shigella sonnei]PAY78434.1 hypothetical protein CEG96_03305 [Shigella flexneri]HAC39292.1 hypothetical protein [Shigella sp.]AWY91954.1 hypothetical protein DIZ83_21875 [Escherichia coli]
MNYVHQAILFVILAPGSARNPHVLCVRSGFSALFVSKLTATITPVEPSSYSLFNFQITKRYIKPLLLSRPL